MKIRYRWDGPWGEHPTIGHYLMSARRARGAYLIVGLVDKGLRGGLGVPLFQLFVLTVERVPCAEALANRDRLYGLKWDARAKRRC